MAFCLMCTKSSEDDGVGDEEGIFIRLQLSSKALATLGYDVTCNVLLRFAQLFSCPYRLRDVVGSHSL